MENKIKAYLKILISFAINQNYTNIGDSNIEISQPPESNMGHYTTNIALQLSKDLKQSPINIANKIIEFINKVQIENTLKEKFLLESKINTNKLNNTDILPIDKFIDSKIDFEIATPGFINIKIDPKMFIYEMFDFTLSNKEILIYKGKTFLIEHTSANPNKDMHVGHLRNNLIGNAIANLWEFTGAKVVRDYVINDRGIAIAKLMWGYLKYARKSENTPVDIDFWVNNKDLWHTPNSLNLSPSRFIDVLYTKGSLDFDESKEIQNTVRKFVLDWENQDKNNLDLWKYLVDLAIDGHIEIMKRLKSKTDKYWRESEHYQKGKDLVYKGLKEGIFKQLEDGAILSNLSKYNLTDTILLKKDGTSLYITQDLALTKLKKDTYSPDLITWVVGPEQSLSFKQLFAICEQLGIGNINEFKHISFGYVTIKGSGKISSRKGNVVYITDLLNDAITKIKNKMISSNDFTEQEIEEYSEKLGIGSVKYAILKISRNQNIEFDLDVVTSIDGDTLPYIMYGFVRSSNLIKNFNSKNLTISEISFNDITQEETELLINLFNYKEVIVMASFENSPNLICTYLYKLAKLFNKFYTNVPIDAANIKEKEDRDYISNRRKYITYLFNNITKTMLNLLGIDTIGKM